MDPDAQILLPKRSSVLPWILFGLALVVGIGGILVEKQKADTDAFRLSGLQKSEAKALAEAAEAVGAKKALETRVQELQTENGRLSVKVAARVESAPAAHAHKKARKHHRKHA
jgi:hypothetical protein